MYYLFDMMIYVPVNTFQLCRDGSSCVELVLDKDKCVLNGGASFVDHLCYFCLVSVMLPCASVYCCLVLTCWERADLLALVCDVLL